MGVDQVLDIPMRFHYKLAERTEMEVFWASHIEQMDDDDDIESILLLVEGLMEVTLVFEVIGFP